MTKTKQIKFIMSGGGTGGHIYPAIAIANELKEHLPNAEFLFVGAKDKMEMQKVPKAGYKIKGLWISGLQRKFTLNNLLFPFKVIKSLWDSFFILKKEKPQVVIGTGGFASGPLLLMASWLKIPTVIQEQNSYPGITNKLLAKRAHKICVAYEGLDKFFPKQKIRFTGNPVRKDLINVFEKYADGITYFSLDPNKKNILVIGGSLGAKRINQLIASHVNWFNENEFQVIWQCGSLYVSTYEIFKQNISVKLFAFIDRMDLAYSVADVIISRAGASSVSELALVAKPTIFIPSPNVAEDHQTKNAKAMVDKKAAIMIKENDLENEFIKSVIKLIKDETYSKKLAKNMYQLAKPNATIDIVEEVVKLVPKHFFDESTE